MQLVEGRTPNNSRNLNLHVNHFTTVDPVTGREFRELTPFISLSAGVVQRDEAAQTNNVHRSLRTALWFGSEFGQLGNAYILTCWLVLAPREAVAIESVAEEVRDLNSYRRYSAFQTEGEIVAKVTIPDNQILSLEKWERGQARQPFRRIWVYRNPRFTRPERLSNIRELI